MAPAGDDVPEIVITGTVSCSRKLPNRQGRLYLACKLHWRDEEGRHRFSNAAAYGKGYERLRAVRLDGRQALRGRFDKDLFLISGLAEDRNRGTASMAIHDLAQPHHRAAGDVSKLREAPHDKTSG